MADEETKDAEKPGKPVMELKDGEYVISISPNGKRNASKPEDERDNFSLVIRHAKHGELYREPHCADNVGFCAEKGSRIVNKLREEEAARKAEGTEANEANKGTPNS